MICDKIFSMIIGVVVTAIVARYFGPKIYGQFNYALAFVSLFTVISTLGLDTFIVKYITDKSEDEGVILCTSFILRIIGGILLTIIAITVIFFLQSNNNTMYLLVFILSMMMVAKSFEVIEYWVIAYQRVKVTSIIRMVVYVVIASLKILIIVNKGTIIQFACTYLVDAVIFGITVLISYYILREDKTKLKFSFDFAKKILSKSWYYILSGLMVAIYMRIDQVMLGSIMPNSTEVGIYSAAVNIAEMWYFVPIAVTTVFQPVIMKLKNINEEKYLAYIYLVYSIVIWIGILFGVVILIFSKLIILILYGKQYMEAVPILTIIVWSGIFATLGTARGVWFVCEDLQRFTPIFMLFGAITNIILNYIFIPILGGKGAAIATLFAQIMVVMLVPYFYKETRPSTLMMLKSFNVAWVLNNMKRLG